MFSFVYSPRPLTDAAQMPNQIDKETAKKRLHKLQNMHKQIQDEIYQNKKNKIYKTLIEEETLARSNNNFTIKIAPSKKFLGKIVDVKIKEVINHNLIGEII
jgi:tRNA-2-methylthio-N6-dimethylallyladenosine synthase